MDIDYIKLRNDLIDYFGTATTCGNPLAIIELSKVEAASNEELINIAINNNFNLNNYINNDTKIYKLF